MAKATKPRGTKVPEYLPYLDAQKWASQQGLSSASEWKKLCKEGKCPANIPLQPNKFYKEWTNYDAWLGVLSQKKKSIEAPENRILYIYNEPTSPRNTIYFGMLVGTVDQLSEIERNHRINIIRRFKYENKIEDYITRVLSAITRTNWVGTQIYNRPFVVSNMNDLFFEIDLNLLKV